MLRLIPFGVLAIMYVVLLKLTEPMAALHLIKLQFKIHNIVLAFCTLFLQEEALSHLNLVVTVTLLFIVSSILGLYAIMDVSTTMLRRTGYFILLAAILPVLIAEKFTLLTKLSNFGDLQNSPSHRIYLASVGVALIGGGFLRTIETRLRNQFPKIASLAVIILLAGAVTGDALLVRERDQLWETEGIKARAVVDFLNSYRGQAVEGSQIALIGFPASRVHMEATIMERLGINDASFIHYVNIGLIEDPKILPKAENSFLFVFGIDGRVHDESQLYRQHLLLSRRAMNDNFKNHAYLSEAQTITFELIHRINQIVGV